MVRIDESRWVKTGVEFTDGGLFLSTVITDGKIRLVGIAALLGA